MAASLRNRVMKSASLSDLPVHARCPLIVDLHAVHAEVVSVSFGVSGIDERQRDERPAVLRPAGDRRQAPEMDVGGQMLDDGATLYPPCADLQKLDTGITRTP